VQERATCVRSTPAGEIQRCADPRLTAVLQSAEHRGDCSAERAEVKVLYLCHRLPFPSTRGGKIRPFNTIRHLSRAHDVTVASLAHTADEAREGAGLADHCRAVIVERTSRMTRAARAIACLPTALPSTMGYFHSPRLARRIRDAHATGEFDLIIAHSSSMAPYVRGMHPPKLLDFCDMDSQKWLAYARFKPFPASWVYRIEGHKLQRAEKRLATAFDVCTCATPGELETLASFATTGHLDWFPNGVDSEYFQPAGAPYDPDTICFAGRMDYYPNQQSMLAFCRDTLPLVRAVHPATRLKIVGADPPGNIRALAAIPGVIVTGTVPDIRPHLGSAALSVAPLRIARGTQNKILESMAMAVPVVSTELAARGVDAVPGEHLLTADRPRDCADAILRLLRDRACRDSLARAARARVQSHHDWGTSMRKLDAIIAECLAVARRPPA
jgi:sugar transferase (PEP-CTERM/EpsH1 system associated)